MAKPIVFEDIFEVLATDPGGKHFDKGGRTLITFPLLLLVDGCG